MLLAPFLYPLKTSENRKVVEIGCTGNEWVKNNILVIYKSGLRAVINVQYHVFCT